MRGQAAVSDELARSDALALLSFLTWRGLLTGPRPHLPALKRLPSPLAGSMPVVAPHAGVLLMRCGAGTQVQCGEPVADLVEPISGLRSTLLSPVDGYLYAHDARCFALAGDKVARVAGPQPMRLGNLLSP